MIFWASCETDSETGSAVDAIRRSAEAAINDALAASSLSTINAEIRYVPIVMPPGLAERYPARSRLQKKDHVYLCAPHLDYPTFVSGTYHKQVTSYFDGLRECVGRLVELGASKEQCAEFSELLRLSRERVLGGH